MAQIPCRTALGSPVNENILWTNRSAADIAEEVRGEGFDVSADTIKRILIEELNLSRRAARKDEASCTFPQRDEQFGHIAALRRKYEKHDWPIVSIDTKKKEILGDFFHPGQAYTNGRVVVADHDFVTSDERLVPYGVYDVRRNEGLMRLACGADTPELACDAIWSWWQRLGRAIISALRDCCCYATAAAAMATGSIGSKKSCAAWLPTCCAIFKSPTIRRAARSIIRSNTGCSVMCRGRYGP
jgi:hypothetical protein